MQSAAPDASPDGGGHVPHRRDHTDSASRTGPTSDFARQTSAARQTSSELALRSRRASRSASRATSMPTSRRKRKQSTTVRAGLVIRAGSRSRHRAEAGCRFRKCTARSAGRRWRAGPARRRQRGCSARSIRPQRGGRRRALRAPPIHRSPGVRARGSGRPVRKLRAPERRSSRRGPIARRHPPRSAVRTYQEMPPTASVPDQAGPDYRPVRVPASICRQLFTIACVSRHLSLPSLWHDHDDPLQVTASSRRWWG